MTPTPEMPMTPHEMLIWTRIILGMIAWAIGMKGLEYLLKGILK